MKPNQSPETIDDYIAGFPQELQAILKKIRETIKKAAPKASEAIKYGLPTFVQNANLVHFGAFKKHIGFYATPAGNRKFRADLAQYPGGKGSVQFPLDQPMPLGLIIQIVKFGVKENLRRSAAKKK
jgi:uncharacterized protein YdhG (YjbR/CyaY superfamily)